MPLIASLAFPMKGRAGAELDDLHQEGRIAVWKSLRNGIHPSSEFVENRMKDWVNFLHRLRRFDTISYDEMLPVDEYRELPDW